MSLYTPEFIERQDFKENVFSSRTKEELLAYAGEITLEKFNKMLQSLDAEDAVKARARIMRLTSQITR